MPNYHMSHISEDISRELTAILRTVKDPRVQGTMLSIVRTEVTNDLSYATVYVSSMDGMDAAKSAVKGLQSAAGYMRRELGAALKLRHVPELRFIADDSIAYSARLSATIHALRREDTAAEEEDV